MSGSEHNLNYASKKGKIIQEILCRWWMCMPVWPPVDTDYTTALTKKGCRLVKVEDWSVEEDDVDGLEKVYELFEFPGVFRKVDGSAIDLRPSEGKPSFEELYKKTEDELWAMLVLGLCVQIHLLRTESPYNESVLIERLERHLHYAERKVLFHDK